MRNMALILFTVFVVPNFGWAETSLPDVTQKFMNGEVSASTVTTAVLKAPGEFEDKVNLVINLITDEPKLRPEQKAALLLQLNREFQQIKDMRDSRDHLWLAGALFGAVVSVMVGPDAPQGADAFQGVANMMVGATNMFVGAGISGSAAVVAGVIWNRISGEYQITEQGIDKIAQVCEQLLSNRRIQPITPPKI